MKSKKNPHAVALGRKGGIERAKKSKAELTAITLKGWRVRRGEEIEDAKKKLASVEC